MHESGNCWQLRADALGDSTHPQQCPRHPAATWDPQSCTPALWQQFFPLSVCHSRCCSHSCEIWLSVLGILSHFVRFELLHPHFFFLLFLRPYQHVTRPGEYSRSSPHNIITVRHRLRFIGAKGKKLIVWSVQTDLSSKWLLI